jgi:hypothetical protein
VSACSEQGDDRDIELAGYRACLKPEELGIWDWAGNWRRQQSPRIVRDVSMQTINRQKPCSLKRTSK